MDIVRKYCLKASPNLRKTNIKFWNIVIYVKEVKWLCSPDFADSSIHLSLVLSPVLYAMVSLAEPPLLWHLQ